MPVEGLERILAAHPFFKGMEERYHQLFVDCASNVRFDAGEYIFREGEEANQFYLIRYGRVAVEISTPARGAVIIQSLGEGEFWVGRGDPALPLAFRRSGSGIDTGHRPRREMPPREERSRPRPRFSTHEACGPSHGGAVSGNAIAASRYLWRCCFQEVADKAPLSRLMVRSPFRVQGRL